MLYPVMIEPGSSDTAWGVVFPDLPGCFSAGDSLEEALATAQEAAAAWIDVQLDQGGMIPPPSPLDRLRTLPEYQGWILAVVDLDPALADDSIERVNITLPRRVLRRLDAMATAAHMSRGALIAGLTVLAHDGR